MTTDSKFEMLLIEKKENVAIVTLNRPKALNALCDQLLKELGVALTNLKQDNEVRAVILTGSKKAFAAGADIKEMSNKSYMENYLGNFLGGTQESFRSFNKPVIAAVSGWALGGGCELAMLCDIIIASESAKFGQPEITIGTIPGMGGTQRLTRAVGKSKAMEIVLTGEPIDAQTAEKSGLVSRVVPDDKLLESAMATAKKIASHSRPVVSMCKDMVNQAFETTLEEGLHFERRTFQSTFALNDQKEGMKAFIEKRPPVWKDQ
jgi:enoyl-CoA hydratase